MVSNPHLISIGYKIDFGIRTISPTSASSSQVLSFEQSAIGRDRIVGAAPMHRRANAVAAIAALSESLGYKIPLPQ